MSDTLITSITSVVTLLIGAALTLLTQGWSRRRSDQRERSRAGRGQAHECLNILSGIRGRRAERARLKDQHVRAYEPSRSENTDLRARRASIPDGSIRDLMRCYLEVVERPSAGRRDLQAEVDLRLTALEDLEEVLGAYIREDPPAEAAAGRLRQAAAPTVDRN